MREKAELETKRVAVKHCTQTCRFFTAVILSVVYHWTPGVCGIMGR